MTRYSTDLPCRPIKLGDTCGHRLVEDARSAASVFADRYARRIYGKRGYCHHVRQDSYTENGRYFNFEAFIGVNAEGGGTVGKNVWLSVKVQ
jgi:hypothetical protein